MYCYNCMSRVNDGSSFCPHCGKSTEDKSCPHHLLPGTVLHNQYKVGYSIGEGGFGLTYVGLDMNLDMKVAIKELYPAGYANRNNTYSNDVIINYRNGGEYFKTGVERFLEEARRIAKFNDESSIVDVRAFFEENNTAYIIMEYLEGENLGEKLQRDGNYAPNDIFSMFLPMMGTLDKMHRERIIHRDITPDNIYLLPDGTLKLIDFGSARYFEGMDKKTMSVQFKRGFAPIEQYNRNGNQGPWTDVYGLCATIYKCITGETPDDSLERSMDDNLKRPSELGIHISIPLEEVLMSGLAVFPEARCQNMKELKESAQRALNNSMGAGVNYGDPYLSGAEVYNHQNEPQELKKKKKIAMIAIISVAALLLIGIVIALIVLFGNMGKKSDEPSSTTQPTTIAYTTAKPTQPTTAKPTESSESETESETSKKESSESSEDSQSSEEDNDDDSGDDSYDGGDGGYNGGDNGGGQASDGGGGQASDGGGGQSSNTGGGGGQASDAGGSGGGQGSDAGGGQASDGGGAGGGQAPGGGENHDYADKGY